MGMGWRCDVGRGMKLESLAYPVMKTASSQIRSRSVFVEIKPQRHRQTDRQSGPHLLQHLAELSDWR